MNVPSTQTTVQMHHQEDVPTPLEVLFVLVTQDTGEMERPVLVGF
jgi:hypothetical protein